MFLAPVWVHLPVQVGCLKLAIITWDCQLPYIKSNGLLKFVSVTELYKKVIYPLLISFLCFILSNLFLVRQFILLISFISTSRPCLFNCNWFWSPVANFSFQPVLHDWCNKGRGMCYPVCGMVHIKEPLLLIGKE